MTSREFEQQLAPRHQTLKRHDGMSWFHIERGHYDHSSPSPLSTLKTQQAHPSPIPRFI
jgi:hypothetical protein